MWITEDDVNFETAKLKIGAHYVPVLVAHINKSLTTGSTLGVESEHLEAFSKKFFDSMGSYDNIKTYGIPPTYYATKVKETTENPLYGVIQVDDTKFRTETLPGFKFPYKCDETVFCKNANTGEDIKYWSGTVTINDPNDPDEKYKSHYCSIYNHAIPSVNVYDNAWYWILGHNFTSYEGNAPGIYSHIQSNHGIFLMIYSDIDNKFFAYHTTIGDPRSNASLPIDIINYNTGSMADSDRNYFIQYFFGHQGTSDEETIQIDFPVKDIVVKNYTPGQPDEPSGDDNKGTSTNDHISIPDGDYKYEGDEIKDDGAPDDNPNAMGTMGLWAPSRAQYKAFCKYLWNGFQQAMVGAFGNNDGMECVLACKEYPFAINATKNATMALGSVDTKLAVDVAPGNYFAIVYKGTVKHPSNSFMDYSPYSKLSVFLPYVGITDLDIDQVSGREVTITYKIDIVSGMGVVLISTIDDDKKNIIIASYPVQMGKELPVTATDYQRAAQSWVGIASTATGVALGGGIPMIAGMALGAAGQAVNSSKADIKQSGSLGGSSGMLGISYPYFIYKMTNFSNSGYKDLIGKKSSAVVKLSTLKSSGYNKIDAVNLHIEGATDEELAEIKQDLLSGVIL